ncbi:hypothetical protein [Streptomyces cellulosae]|nr:hypothetical protein [Streptomyces cellulosae]
MTGRGTRDAGGGVRLRRAALVRHGAQHPADAATASGRSGKDRQERQER